MKTYSSLSFHGDALPGGPENFLRAAGIRDDEFKVTRFTVLRVENVTVRVALPEGDERIPRLLELLKQHGEEPLEGGFDEYTDEELDNARLLALRPILFCKIDGGCEFGTTYDLKGTCPSCGAGARQTSAMFLDGWDDQQNYKLKGHRAAQTLFSDVLVDDRLAAEIDALAPMGLVLHQVYAVNPDTKRQTKLTWKQLSADRILPPMSPQTEGLSRSFPCDICTRSGYWVHSCARVCYRIRDLEGAGDVNLSWEAQHKGLVKENPRGCQIPVPLLLVTPKVMHVFRAAGVTEAEWIPIRVVDE